MSKKVDKWLEKGRKNCAKGEHWFKLDYGTYLVCPICGEHYDKVDINEMNEHNCFLVNSMEFERAKT